MGKAGKALREVLKTSGISQNKLAVVMGIGRSTVNHWVNEKRDPLAETIPEIVAALETLDEDAAKNFLFLYLGRVMETPPPDDGTS